MSNIEENINEINTIEEISQEDLLHNNPDFEDELTDEEKQKIKEKEQIEIAKKKKKVSEINKLSNLSNNDIERAIIYVWLQHYSNNFSDFVTENNLKSWYFISKTGKFIFDITYDLFNEKWKVDFLLLKEELSKKKYEKDSKNLSIKDFLNFQWFIPKKELAYEYVQLLVQNNSKNDFNNLVLNLNKAIKENDEINITYLKWEIANFEFENWTDEENPDIWLISNEYLSKQSEEYVNGWYKTSRTVLKTGFKNMDEWIGWIERWNFVVFAARPSVWKSVNMLALMESMERQWYTWIYVSWEMYWRYIYSRWLSIKLNISQEKIKNPSKMTAREKQRWKKFNDEFKNNSTSHFYFNSIITARDIEEIWRKVKNKYWKLDVIFVDYLWKMYPNNMNMDRNRTVIVWDISRELFNLCSKLDIAVITASQLSRWSSKDAEIQSMVAPKMTDLRDSWDIEQDADMIIWLTRNVKEAEICYTEEDKQDFVWHVIKNRNGKIWEYTFDYYPTTFRLVDKTNDFYSDEETPEWLAKKVDKKAQEKAITDLLEEEDWNAFINATDSIFDN